jgi:hypothetical protein
MLLADAAERHRSQTIRWQNSRGDLPTHIATMWMRSTERKDGHRTGQVWCMPPIERAAFWHKSAPLLAQNGLLRGSVRGLL